MTFAEPIGVARLADADPVASLARTLQMSLIGFPTAAWFLSRTYTTLLFVLLACTCAVADLARRERGPIPTLGPAAWCASVCMLEGVSVGMACVFVQFTR